MELSSIKKTEVMILHFKDRIHPNTMNPKFILECFEYMKKQYSYYYKPFNPFRTIDNVIIVMPAALMN